VRDTARHYFTFSIWVGDGPTPSTTLHDAIIAKQSLPSLRSAICSGTGAASFLLTAFYEWQRSRAAKQPYCFEVDGSALFAFAGIWEKWKDPAGTTLETCAILTTTPNAATSAIHDRMPVILDPESHDLWLDPRMKDAETAAEMLKPYDANAMSCYPISTRINQVSNDDEECAARVDLVPAQARLFL
jgi:hypothetical protein